MTPPRPVLAQWCSPGHCPPPATPGLEGLGQGVCTCPELCDPLLREGTASPLATAPFLWGLMRGQAPGLRAPPYLTFSPSFTAALGGSGWQAAPPLPWPGALIWGGHGSPLAEFLLALNGLTSASC